MARNIDQTILSESDTSHKKSSKTQLWDEIGFHRPLAGFWYKLVFEIGIIVIPIFLTPFTLKYIYPFPTSIGYRSTFSSLFVLVFTIFDIGTANTISRFIADENIKNPDKMVQYIQYFIWYQSLTGLLQITGISIWIFYFVPTGELAYGSWIMLIVIIKQWPGFPGVFKGVLSSLQQFNKRSTIDFIQGEAIQRFTEIGFVLLGSWYGRTHPEIGMLLGIAMGSVFGLYFDDILASIIAAYYLAKAMEPYGITFKRLFKIEFDFKLAKRCFSFGLRTGIPSLVSALTQVISLTLVITYIPQYTTFYVLMDMAYMLISPIQRLTYQDFTPSITEAYQNGKTRLCEYYNRHIVRFFFTNYGFSLSILLPVFMIFEYAIGGFGLTRYLLAIPFMVPALIRRSMVLFTRYCDGILIGAGKAKQYFWIKMAEEVGKMLCWFLTVYVFRIQDLGLAGIVYTITLGEFPAILLKLIFTFNYENKKIFRLKIMPYQSFFVPFLSTGILFGIFLLIKLFILDSLWDTHFILALIVAILAVMILSIICYFPLTVILGGWDDNSIGDFKKIISMAGPSKIIVKPLAKLIIGASKRAKLHNRHKLDDPEAMKEVEELFQIREANRKRAQIKIE